MKNKFWKFISEFAPVSRLGLKLHICEILGVSDHRMHTQANAGITATIRRAELLRCLACAGSTDTAPINKLKNIKIKFIEF